MRRNKEIMRPSCSLGPATWDETMFNYLFHSEPVAAMVDNPWECSHQLRHKVWTKVCPWQLGRVEVGLGKGWIQSKHFLHQR